MDPKNKQQQDNISSPDFLQVFPKQGEDYPLVPVKDDQANDFKAEEITIPRSGLVYFEMHQGCHNFEGHEGHVKQIVLVPSVTATKVHPPASVEMGIAKWAKHRRLSF